MAQPPFPHGPIEEVFPSVYQVTGTFPIGPGMTLGRTMTIVKQGDELTLVNVIRLTPEGEEALGKLGRVKHVVRLSHFHGAADEPYVMQRFAPTLWAPRGVPHTDGVTSQELRPGPAPISGAQVFLFEGGQIPDAALLLEREGGILITCDAYQNWTTFERTTWLSWLMLKSMKFGPNVVGPIWAKKMGPGVRPAFDRLLALEWRHIVTGHGTPVKNTGKEALREAVKKKFG